MWPFKRPAAPPDAEPPHYTVGIVNADIHDTIECASCGGTSVPELATCYAARLSDGRQAQGTHFLCPRCAVGLRWFALTYITDEEDAKSPALRHMLLGYAPAIYITGRTRDKEEQ